MNERSYWCVRIIGEKRKVKILNMKSLNMASITVYLNEGKKRIQAKTKKQGNFQMIFTCFTNIFYSQECGNYLLLAAC